MSDDARSTGDFDDDWTPPPWGFGTVGGIDREAAARDLVAELYAVVEEITGRPVERRRPRIGFLP